jgi:DNA-binding HxlR family transcriptional regulator
MDKAELFIELMSRPLAFKIITLLTLHGDITIRKIKALLDHRYDEHKIRRTLKFLEQAGLITKKYDGKSNVIALNTENEFANKLARLINMLYARHLLGVFEQILGTKARARAIIALMRGPMVKSELAKEAKTINGAPTDIMLEPLLKNGIIIKHKGRRRVEYELNMNHPLVQILVEFLRDIGVNSNHNNHNNGNKDMYYMLAREFVDYVIEHWDEFVVNIHRKDTIKLTGPVIKSIATKIAETKGWKIHYIGWLIDFIIEEFRKRGFRVDVKKLGQKPNVTRVKVYVHKN